jgi:hypothetical protein
MLFMRGHVGYIFSDCRTTEEIATELCISEVIELMKQYRFEKEIMIG